MSKRIIIDAGFPSETRVVLLNGNNNIEDIEYENTNKPQSKSNIYLAKITRVEPSLQAAFIDYGSDKSGFLPFSEISPDYYHIPIADQNFSLSNLKEITPPKINQNELEEPISNYDEIINNDEMDFNALEKLVDDKTSSAFDIEASETDIETIGSDNRDDSTQHKYKIQEVIKKGQVLLVQIIKEERGNKGASFSTYISLAGKYCVLMPNKSSQNGVSRKISHASERKRLKDIISSISAENDKSSASVIVRTAGIGRSAADIKRDYNYLVKLWNKIREVTLKSIAPCFIHQEEGIIQKALRDMFDHNVRELLIVGDEAYKSAIKFMNDILPSEVRKIKEYKNKIPVFTKFGIDEQLSNLYQPIVSLESGGYIVINPTEALTSIDVNSGRAISERNIEETALKTNLEAAREIARQVRLRDISGLIVIDFIDMSESRNRKIIERSLKEFLGRDRARIHTANISQFGLLEMSRQRLRPSFLELNSTICHHCSGKGVVRAQESNSMLMLRTVENEIFNDDKVETVNVYANEKAIIYLLNHQRKEISYMETKYRIKLNFHCDPSATADSYSVEKIRIPRTSSTTSVGAQNKPALQDVSDIYNDNANDKHQDKMQQKRKQKWKTAANVERVNSEAEKTIETAELNNSADEHEPRNTGLIVKDVAFSDEQVNANIATQTDDAVTPALSSSARRRRIRKKPTKKIDVAQTSDVNMQ